MIQDQRTFRLYQIWIYFGIIQKSVLMEIRHKMNSKHTMQSALFQWLMLIYGSSVRVRHLIFCV